MTGKYRALIKFVAIKISRHLISFYKPIGFMCKE